MTPGEVLAEAARRLPAARCVAEAGVAAALAGPGGAGGAGTGTGAGAADMVTMDVPRQDWLAALAFARDAAGSTSSTG